MVGTRIKVLNGCLLISILAAMVLGLKLGIVEISLGEFMDALLWPAGSGRVDPDRAYLRDILWDLRFPRVFLALSIGMGLSLSGMVMQAVVKNPLADPYILGVSAGAALGATMAIFFGWGNAWGSEIIGISACIGAFSASILVILVANLKDGTSAGRLLISGIALGIVCSGLSNLIVYMGQNKEGMESLTFWLMGNVSNARMDNVVIFFVIVILALLFFSTQTRVLNIMLLGEAQAMTLGIDLRKYLVIYLLINGGIVGFAVLNAGMIGFIGLIVPHIAKLTLGENHGRNLLTAVLFGGLVTVAADIVSRVVLHGVDIPIGIIFAFIGAPLFVGMLLRRRLE